MRIELLLIISLVFLLSGCATGRNSYNVIKKVEALESRINSLEEKQATLETQTAQSLESAGHGRGGVDNAPKSSSVVTTGLQENEGYSSDVYKKKLTKKEIQVALKNAGFYAGAVDGVIGKNTKKQ